MVPITQPTVNVSAGNLQSGARVALLGMVINLVFAIAKVTAGVFGNSYVLIADGIESALDIGGSIVIWGGLKIAARPPDATHPYGHGKAEPVAAAIVAFGVLAAALGLAIQSVREIFLPHHAPAPFTLVVLVVVIVVKELLYRFVIRIGRDVASTAVQTDAWHHRFDAMTSGAAFVGISIALLGGEGWESADDWAALFACMLIGANGFRLLLPAVREILDTAPDGDVREIVARAAGSVPGVYEVEKCLVRKMGLNFYADLHVKVDGTISVRDGHAIAHEVKNAIRATDSRIADVLVHVEPA
ncbi:MAG: cation diffusion facilitator family transporter [Chthoniobacterales bacterium]